MSSNDKKGIRKTTRKLIATPTPPPTISPPSSPSTTTTTTKTLRKTKTTTNTSSPTTSPTTKPRQTKSKITSVVNDIISQTTLLNNATTTPSTLSTPTTPTSRRTSTRTKTPYIDPLSLVPKSDRKQLQYATTPHIPSLDWVITTKDWITAEGKIFTTFNPINRDHWRSFLHHNHKVRDNIWVIFNMPGNSLTWSDAVDEAICYGWIDSTRRKFTSTDRVYNTPIHSTRTTHTTSSTSRGRSKNIKSKYQIEMEMGGNDNNDNNVDEIQNNNQLGSLLIQPTPDVSPVHTLAYMQLFTPRNPTKSKWSAINKKKVDVLIDNGLMTDAGLIVINKAKENGLWNALDDVEALNIPEDLLTAFQLNEENQKKLEIFQNQSRSKQKLALHSLVDAKKEETRMKRIQLIINNIDLNTPIKTKRTSKKNVSSSDEGDNDDNQD